MKWLPALVAVTVALATAVVARTTLRQQDALARGWVAVFADSLATNIFRDLRHQADALHILGHSADADPAGDWAAAVAPFRTSHPAFLAVQLRDSSGGIIASVGEPAALATLSGYESASVTASTPVRFSPAVSVVGTTLTIVSAAVEGRQGGRIVLGAIDLDALMDPVVASQARLGRELRVAANGLKIGSSRSSGRGQLEQLKAGTTTTLDRLELSVELIPAAAGPIALSRRSALPVTIMVGGLLLGVLLGVAVGLWQAVLERNARLQKDVAARLAAERALEEHSHQLERSNRELEQFAYVASHDLQEPLRMIASYTQLLERRYGPRLDDTAREFIRFAVDGAHRMQQLINDLLAYARLDTRGGAMVDVNTSDVVRRALANLQLAIREAGARVEAGELPAVTADPGQLAQVFQNLVGNALKFAGPAAPIIQISGTRRGDRVELSVSDNGIGIPPEHSERVFRLFQRLHAVGEYPGTGIGLTICQKIVHRHGGTIRVESAPGRGATFLFTLPAAASGAKPVMEPAA